MVDKTIGYNLRLLRERERISKKKEKRKSKTRQRLIQKARKRNMKNKELQNFRNKKLILNKCHFCNSDVSYKSVRGLVGNYARCPNCGAVGGVGINDHGLYVYWTDTEHVSNEAAAQE